MNIIRKRNVDDWTVGCIVKYGNEYCLIVENDFADENFALLNVNTNSVSQVFDQIEELNDIELITSDLDVDIYF